METGSCSYTLHGHFGGISCLEVDKTTPNSALSGCKVGQICLWDLTTGTCLFNLEAHTDAAVTALLATSLYAISLGTDNKINIWDKYSGHLVHSLPNQRSFCSGMVPLRSNILITAKEDHLVLWDLSEAAPLRVINLSSFGDSKSSCIRAMHTLYTYFNMLVVPSETMRCSSVVALFPSIRHELKNLKTTYKISHIQYLKID